MTLAVKVTTKLNIVKATKRIQRQLNSLPKDSIKEFIKLTPIRSGNARKNTSLNGDTIEADYPYALVLEEGRRMTSKGMRGSTQAPKGMTTPFFKWLNARTRRIFGKRL